MRRMRWVSRNHAAEYGLTVYSALRELGLLDILEPTKQSLGVSFTMKTREDDDIFVSKRIKNRERKFTE